MNDRFRNDRSRGGQSGWEGRNTEPLYSSDEDETRGSEWTRDRNPRYGAQEGRYLQGGGYGQSGTYGQGRGYGGTHGGYGGTQGGHGSTQGGYGGTHGGYGSTQGGYGDTHGGYGSTHGGHGGTQAGYSGAQGGNLGAGSTRGDGQIAWGDSVARPPGGYAGRGPKGYVRSDERIREDVCEYLSADDDVDASDIEVRVQDGEVTLEGTVQTRSMKHHAENLVDEVAGVKDVHNRLRVSKSMLNEIKDKLTGEESHHHYANGGTKAKPANGRLSD